MDHEETSEEHEERNRRMVTPCHFNFSFPCALLSLRVFPNMGGFDSTISLKTLNSSVMQNSMNPQFEDVRAVGKSAFKIACLCFGLMTLGSVVRTTDSGLSCPDWPMCFGRLVPNMDIQIFLEWFHRLIALILGILLFRISWKVMRTPALRRVFSKEIYLAFTLFIWQCVLGGLTVLKLLNPSIVSSHLLTALLFFGLLLWIWRRSYFFNVVPVYTQTSQFTQWALLIAAVCVYVQLGVGGMVSSNNAGLICPDFPTCHGSWTGLSNHLTFIQMVHRYFAFALFGFSLFLFVKCRHENNLSAAIALRAFPLFLSLQILLGVLNIFFAMPLWARVAHHANGIFIFATVLVGGFDLLLVRQHRKNIHMSGSFPMKELAL